MSDTIRLDAPQRVEPARKYLRPRLTVSWPGLLFGLAVGIGIGLLYAWVVSPVEEFDTAPWQLSNADKAHYVVAIMLDYSYDSDLNGAVSRLLDLRLEGDPIQAVADTACALASSGYVESNSGLHAIRAMKMFYQLQGKSGCADTLIPEPESQPTVVAEVILPTATFMPPATKTPTPEPPSLPTSTPVAFSVPTAVPQTDFAVVSVATFCSSEASGVIEIYVQNENGEGIPGQDVRVRWDRGDNRFATGLKPERGAGYADFLMEADTGYVVDMPGHSEPLANPISPVPCTTSGGEAARTSYRVIFRPS